MEKPKSGERDRFLRSIKSDEKKKIESENQHDAT